MSTLLSPGDILRLFISAASFLAGSKRRQLGYDKTLKKLMMHNDTDDTLAAQWSGDSLQCLLASSQTLTGKKRFNGGIKLPDGVPIELGDDEEGSVTIAANGSQITLDIDNQSAIWTIKAASTTNVVITKNSLALNRGLVFDSRLAAGSGYLNPTVARANEIDISSKNLILMTPASSNETYYAFGSKVDGQMLVIANLSTLYDLYIDQDETGGIYLEAASDTHGCVAVWDETLDKWIKIRDDIGY